MKIINFNRRDKVDNTGLLDTYIDGNKQYCYDLNRKITSLYDYMMGNYPEYFIFNAPNSLSGLDNFIPYKSLVDTNEEPRLVQPYEKHVAFNSDKPNLSIFFPSRLNYHQGFYNQSSYGDAILIHGNGSKGVSSSRSIYTTKLHHLFTRNGESGIPSVQSRKIMYDEVYLYDETLEGKGKWKRSSFLEAGVQRDDWITGQLTYLGNGKCFVINSLYDVLCGHTELVYNSNQNSIILETTIDQTIHILTEHEDTTYDLNTYTVGTYNNLVTSVDKASYINFPSGYICILNKQSIGANNEQNPIKNNLSNYLIAPMGNGGYYDIWGNNNILQADYKANELNNFSSKLTINLAQNCRYINPSNDTFSFKGQQLNVTIPNGYIGNNEAEPQLSDKYDNIGTGQEDLVAQPYFNGEKMFAEIQYDSFKSVVKQQNVHNFNAHTDKPFSLAKVSLLIY